MVIVLIIITARKTMNKIKKPNPAAKTTMPKMKSILDKTNNDHHHDHKECKDHNHHHTHKEHNNHSHHSAAKNHDLFCYGEKILKISEHMNKHLMDYNNSIYLDNMKLYQKLINCTNVNELVELQENLIQHNMKNIFDKTMNIASELGDHAKEFSELVAKNCNHN
jgi:ABC-type Zn2+ transport system substrate-binding protein/surface adhesin